MQLLVFQNQKQIDPISTMLDFLYNFCMYLNARYIGRKNQMEPTNKLLRRLIHPNHPTVADMQRHSAFVWVNTHELTDFARATHPKLKFIGGIAIKKPEPLNQVIS